MNLIKLLILFAFVVIAGDAKADVECIFDSRSTREGLEGLDHHTFRVVNSSSGTVLESRTADGSWLGWGLVEQMTLPEYLVFQHYPTDPGGNPLTLTIHQSGRATLLLYVDPYKTWLYYGDCTGT
jgi:hypothetical protein